MTIESLTKNFFFNISFSFVKQNLSLSYFTAQSNNGSVLFTEVATRVLSINNNSFVFNSLFLFAVCHNYSTAKFSSLAYSRKLRMIHMLSFVGVEAAVRRCFPK